MPSRLDQTANLGGLVEGILALHQPGNSYNGLLEPIRQGCRECTGSAWPCATVRLVAEATGSPVPAQRMTTEPY